MFAHRSERGQALVLIVLAIVGLFGFLALAVDGGRIYSERRRSQSAADAAALTAAYTSADTENDPLAAAWNTAMQNGFNDDGITNRITVNNPPVGGPYDGDVEYYQVIIWEHVDPVFAQFVFSGTEEITSEAVARAQPSSTVSSGNAVHSLSEDCGGGKNDNSMTLNGTTQISVDGGNMFSNGCWKKTGKSGKVRITNTDDHGAKSVRSGGIQVAGPDWTCTGCSLANDETATVRPGIKDRDDGITQQFVPDLVKKPYCPTSDAVIDGVHYYIHPSGISSGKTTLVLPPGIHCVTGDLSGKIQGNNVFIYLKTGGFRQTGGDSLDLRSAQDLKDANGTQWGGMVIYAPFSNKSELEFGGNAYAYFEGTIFAPGGTCGMGGTSDGRAYRSALICNKVNFHGTPAVSITYRQEELFHFPPIVELSQ